jgi:SAM-dependent methyltransferase
MLWQQKIAQKLMRIAMHLAGRDDLEFLLRLVGRLGRLPPLQDTAPESQHAEQYLRVVLDAHSRFERLVGQASVLHYGGRHPKHHLWTAHSAFLVDNVEHGSRVLDIGCGASLYLQAIAEKASQIVAIDINPQRIEASRRTNTKPNVSYLVMDAMHELPPGGFDTVICSHVLEHLDDPLPLLRKLRTSAQRILVRVPLEDATWIKLVKRDLGLVWMDDKDHRREYSEELLRQQLSEAGWTKLEIYRGFDLRAIAHSKESCPLCVN